MKSLLFLLTLAYFFSPLLTPVFADVIYYRSGRSEKGLVVEEHHDRIVLSTEGGEKPILRKEIDQIFYDDPERNYLYLGKEALEGEDFAMAKGFFRKALQMNPDFQEAEDAIHRLEDLQQKAFPSSEADPVAALQARWGLTLSQTEDSLPVVKSVQEGSFALRSKIVSGDILVGAWGESLAFRPLKEVAEALLGPAGSVLKLTLRRSAFIPGNPSKPHWPEMTIEMERLGLTVSAVEPSGSAALAGLQLKDRIISLGGRSTRYLPLTQARRALHQVQKNGISLGFERDLMVKRE